MFRRLEQLAELHNRLILSCISPDHRVPDIRAVEIVLDESAALDIVQVNKRVDHCWCGCCGANRDWYAFSDVQAVVRQSESIKIAI